MNLPGDAAAETPDSKAGGFIETAPDPLRYGHQNPAPFECDGLALSMIPRGSRVLDVGCGIGDLSARVRDSLGATVVGVELDAARAVEARKRGLEVTERDLADIPDNAFGPFDVILYMDVLEHLSDPAAQLRAARRFLAPGGSIIASIPNIAHWSVRMDLVRGRFDYEEYGIMDATHLRWFTARTVQSLFAAIGARVVEHHYSAGAHFRFYGRRPWSWLPAGVRRNVVLAGVRHAPRLFGAQHVVRAVLAT